ncbi:S41 family peptidase [Leptospira gomenensis]|uniref:S41 family peptidase n=1 Tax=Leptospira gomenensis TaxID=2484974 RepID=A0A5F1Z2P0_9LEPT|nr:S41 family peptidase [Leptospira gomenensis]TGK28925.1 S41 family peptidase [Leptospira gomenensis]TGK40684.1 S41 family peptidase [Leptospira gomenensis]TGK42505.1 S41 family peptidase [Leptospira gomenensis]TGK68472.1 S41 family peptidase [Leptospira gomenensis]
MKNKERLVWIGIVSFLSFALILPNGSVKGISKTGESYLQIFHEVLSFIQTDYVESVDDEKLYQGAIRGLIASLGDPHSRFMDKDDFSQLQEETRGSFGGLGMEVSFADGAIVVISPIEDTPAMKAGILPQDRIVEIDGKKTGDLSLSDSIKLMRGKVGTSVTIKLERKNQKEPMTLTLVREMIKIRYVRSSFLEKEKLGYIKLNQFMGKDSTLSEFKKELAALKEKGAEGLIVDLRMNPGGLLDLAIALSDLFLKPDLDIVSVRGRGGELVRVFRSTSSGDKAIQIPMVVLINEGSASASEIFAGAIQDHGRGKILGTVSFGKGSVQNIYPLSHNTGIALTIQKYYTPSGKSIHGKGIQPDVLVKSVEPTEDDRFYIRKMAEKKMLEAFVAKNPVYSEANFQLFEKYLSEKGMKLSSDVARFLYKSRSNKEGQSPLLDLDLDPQMKKAIELLSVPKEGEKK